MRVTCTLSDSGPTYRIYRSSDDFGVQVKRLIPLLLANRCDVLIGATPHEPDVVLTIGPLDADQDASFRAIVAARLGT